MMRVWMLSQGYHCPDRSDFHNTKFPVCSAYGYNFHMVRQLVNETDWELVQIDTTVHQIEAAQQDPRVIYCGVRDDDPPAKLLEVYADLLDPNKTYITVGQVIARLAKTEPSFHHEF